MITATEVTRGDVNAAHLLIPLWEAHQAHTGARAETVVADSKYGTAENFLAAHDRGIAAHIPDLRRHATERAENRRIFTDTFFAYDQDSDTYRCPAGQRLKRTSFHATRNSTDYAASKKICAACALRPECTHHKMGRPITRHLRQQPLDQMRANSGSAQARRDIRIRQHLMERSFARASRFGVDHARWRGLWRVRIQEYLTATIQNIEVLMRYGGDSRRRPGVLMRKIKPAATWMQGVGRMISNLLPHPGLVSGPIF